MIEHSPAGAWIGASLAILMSLGVIVGYIIMLVAVWRLMKAHESIADTLRDKLGGQSGRPFGQ